MIRNIYKFLSSVKLAISLLIIILVCCIAGVTIFRGERAWSLIFSTIWFNGLLVLLVLNVAFCFFPRTWGRRLTIISVGMILFHMSFVLILGGIVYNSLFYFRGLIRLTEGESLPSGRSESYDVVDKGRFFKFSRLKGETALIKMYTGYKIGKEDKRAAYEVAIGEGGTKQQGVIYITHSLEHRGFSYFNDREGYSLLIVLCDKQGNELYGAHFPLQSIMQDDGKYLYTTGTRHGPGTFLYPQKPVNSLFHLQAAYYPTPVAERAGEVYFKVWPVGSGDEMQEAQPLAEGKTEIGERFRAGDYFLSVKEVRYWVIMSVRYEPGKPIVLASLWIGLGGIVLTFAGRLRTGKR